MATLFFSAPEHSAAEKTESLPIEEAENPTLEELQERIQNHKNHINLCSEALKELSDSLEKKKESLIFLETRMSSEKAGAKTNSLSELCDLKKKGIEQLKEQLKVLNPKKLALEDKCKELERLLAEKIETAKTPSPSPK